MALSDNLVAYYKLDETSWTSITDSVTSWTGTLTNATQNSWGKIWYCTSFWWQWYYATCPTISDHIWWGNTMSVNAWVYRADNNVFRSICWERQQSWDYYLNFLISSNNDDNKLIFQTYWQNNWWWVACCSINTIPQNTRTMITWTYDGSKMRVYINWAYENEANQTVTLYNNTWSNLMIGRNSWPASQQDWNWRIDEVWVRSRCLSATEISTLYNSWSGNQYPFTETSTFIPKIIQF